jgi:excisionase family DNA binding protein
LNKEPTTTPRLVAALQLKAAAVYLGCSEITVRRLVKRGLLRPNRAIKRLLFPVKELDRFLEET